MACEPATYAWSWPTHWPPTFAQMDPYLTAIVSMHGLLCPSAQGRHRGDGQSRGDLKKPGTRSLAHLADFNAIAGLADSGVTTESLCTPTRGES